MDDLRKAAEMALDALDAWLVADVTKLPIVIPQTENTVFALRQALAQPEQVSIEPPDYVEPVTYDYHEGWEKGFKDGVESVKNKKESTPSNVDPLLHGGDGNYIKQAQPEQEPAPVGMTCKVWTHGCALFDGIDLPNETLLYTAPPSKPWVSLTDDEIAQVVGSPIDEVYLSDFRNVEAKLKERNNG